MIVSIGFSSWIEWIRLLQDANVDILVTIAKLDDTGNVWFWFTWLYKHFKDYAYKNGAKDYIVAFTEYEITKDKKSSLLFGKIHSIFDSPAIEWANGVKKWYKGGKLHRDNDLPAVECTNGDKFWFKEDKPHRENDLPAVEYANGNKAWYKEGRLHRDNDLPAIVRVSGYKYWYKEGVKYIP